MKKFLIGAIGAFTFAAPSYASSDDAWEEFRQETKAKCTEALFGVEGRLAAGNFAVHVSDYGSESFGTALIRLKRAEAPRFYICVMDKRTKKAEIASLP